MPVDEFSLIQQFFDRSIDSEADSNVLLGIGDDAAVVHIPAHSLLVQTMDTLVAGRHFPLDTDPQSIAYKSLAVNVSDLVSMAASPAFFLLSLTLPRADKKFLAEFSDGLFHAANEFAIRLIGGDTCKGPLSVSIQASGLVPDNGYITRGGAQAGDRIMVSGQLGKAALGLASMLGEIELSRELRGDCARALNRPQPRVDLIPLLRQFASSAIDLSDGLVGDLRHILGRSAVGATIEKSRIPVPDIIRQKDIYHYALQGGDDYQLLFTVPEDRVDELLEQVTRDNIDLTPIGVITHGGFSMNTDAGPVDLSLHRGFDHFAQG